MGRLWPSLEARLHEIERVADDDAYRTGDIAGPEVCGHVRDDMGKKLGKCTWRGTLAMEECGAFVEYPRLVGDSC